MAAPPPPPPPPVTAARVAPARTPHTITEAEANSAAFAAAAGQSPSWLSDPFRRHIHRYWNGKRWTDQVANNGVQSTDPFGAKGEPLRSPGGAATLQPAWMSDPSGRHGHRYWNSKRWTDQVANNGVVAVDPPTVEGI